VGVLVVAHGGNNRWDGLVRKAVAQARLDVPVQVAFGMGMHEAEGRAFQDAVNRLQRKGIDRLVVVPLLVSSHSEVFRQYAYLFRVRAAGEWNEVAPLQIKVPVVMGKALDDDAVVTEILLERAESLSRSPSEETVILVGHGPVADEEASRWLEAMGRLGEEVKRRGAFAGVLSALLRDDAPAAIKEEASRQLREAVRQAGTQSRVLVVPLLIASGGIEQKIPKLLSGLPYAYDGEALLPHPKLSQWIARQVEELSTQGSEGAPLVLK
jgi:sirohydrochlorin ferrochelatase